MSGRPRASTSTPSLPATSPPTIPKPSAGTRLEAPRSSPASPPAVGAIPEISRAPSSSSPVKPPAMSTAKSSSSMGDGWDGESVHIAASTRPAAEQDEDRQHHEQQPERD